MKIPAIDHVNIAIPVGGEDLARSFYGDILGFVETPKPENLADRGGVWFEQGEVKIHLGVEKDFRPAKKAHPAFVTDDLRTVVERCKKGGYHVVMDEPALEGYNRVHIFDPFGNRIEIMERVVNGRS